MGASRLLAIIILRARGARQRILVLTCGMRLRCDDGALRGDVHDLPVLFLDHAFETNLDRTATTNQKTTRHEGWVEGGKEGGMLSTTPAPHAEKIVDTGKQSPFSTTFPGENVYTELLTKFRQKY